MPTRTPGGLYAVRQSHAHKLAWVVIPVDEAQGRAMRDREEPHVYDTSAQAHEVKKQLNDKRNGQLTLTGRFKQNISMPGTPTEEGRRIWETFNRERK